MKARRNDTKAGANRPAKKQAPERLIADQPGKVIRPSR
jgi:hypothetical protein